MSTDPPGWWPLISEDKSCSNCGRGTSLANMCLEAAEEGYPNEVCGMIICECAARSEEPRANYRLHLFRAISSPTSVFAYPEDVVRFSYWLDRTKYTVAATFHSHPGGQTRFSVVDQGLRMWASHHVVAVRVGASWNLMFAS